MVCLPVNDAVQISGDRSDVGRDRHLIVVQNNQHLLLQRAEIIDALESDAARKPGIAHHGDNVEILPFQIARHSHAQRA